MKLTKKSETSSKITFTYDKPTAETEGYIYYANDVAVSRTFNPDDLEVTFGKVPSGRYAVDAIGFEELDRAEWPEVSIPPPPVGDLRFKPPGWNGGDPTLASSFPGYKVQAITGPATYNLDNSTDYFLDWGDFSFTGKGNIVLNGGRNLVCVGGAVTHTNSSGDGGDDGILIEGGAAGATVHLEGLKLLDVVNGFTVRTPRFVTLQNIHIAVRGFQDNASLAHPDLIQVWTGNKCPGIRVHRFTGYSRFTFFSDFTDATVAQRPEFWELHDVDLHGRPPWNDQAGRPDGLNLWMGYAPEATWRGSNCWFETTYESSGNRRVLGSHLRQFSGGSPTAHAGYTIYNQAGVGVFTAPVGFNGGSPGDIGRTQGDRLVYTDDPRQPRMDLEWRCQKPTAADGADANGNFVPAGLVGAGYRSPGYR